MKRMRFIPTRVSSSTTYCTTGLRPTGSISFGCDLVAGSRRVPRPATGMTAMSISMQGMLDSTELSLEPRVSTVMRLKHVLRRLAQKPGFTIVAVITLALGIGANSAVFSVIEGVLLRPLPYPRADELVALDHAAPGVNLASAGSAPFLYFTYREDAQSFQDIGMWQPDTMSV